MDKEECSQRMKNVVTKKDVVNEKEGCGQGEAYPHGREFWREISIRIWLAGTCRFRPRTSRDVKMLNNCLQSLNIKIV